jgi:hypothetical protein
LWKLQQSFAYALMQLAACDLFQWPTCNTTSLHYTQDAAAAAAAANAAAAAAAAEINEAYNAFEEQRQQNATLLGQLTERDGALAGAQQDRLKLEHQLAQMAEQVGKWEGLTDACMNRLKLEHQLAQMAEQVGKREGLTYACMNRLGWRAPQPAQLGVATGTDGRAGG